MITNLELVTKLATVAKDMANRALESGGSDMNNLTPADRESFGIWYNYYLDILYEHFDKQVND